MSIWKIHYLRKTTYEMKYLLSPFCNKTSCQVRTNVTDWVGWASGNKNSKLQIYNYEYLNSSRTLTQILKPLLISSPTPPFLLAHTSCFWAVKCCFRAIRGFEGSELNENESDNGHMTSNKHSESDIILNGLVIKAGRQSLTKIDDSNRVETKLKRVRPAPLTSFGERSRR